MEEGIDFLKLIIFKAGRWIHRGSLSYPPYFCVYLESSIAKVF